MNSEAIVVCLLLSWRDFFSANYLFDDYECEIQYMASEECNLLVIIMTELLG